MEKSSFYHLFSDIEKDDDPLYVALKQDIHSIKVIFNPSEHSIDEIIQEFINYRRKNSYSVLNPLFMLNYFAKTRPKYLSIVKELFPVLLSDPKKIRTILTNTKYHSQTCIYNLVQNIFPPEIDQGFNEIPKAYGLISESVFPPESLFSYIFQDDIDGFLEYMTKNPSTDISKPFVLPIEVSAAFFDGEEEIHLLDLCCFFGSVKCYNHLIQNGARITGSTNKMAVAGANQEIVHSLQQLNCSFDNCLTVAIQHNRDKICDMLLTNYTCEDITFDICLRSYNFEAFVFFFHNAVVDSKSPLVDIYQNALQAATAIDCAPVVNYLKIRQRLLPK